MAKNIALRKLEKVINQRNFLAKLILSIACLGCSFWHIGFYKGCPWINHVIYSFFHANIFHLIINLMVLWGIKNKLRPHIAMPIAIVSSFLPMYVSEPTMGLSGYIFAELGLMWGNTGYWRGAIRKALPVILITMLIPNINGLLHLYAFFIGLVFLYIAKATAHHE